MSVEQDKWFLLVQHRHLGQTDVMEFDDLQAASDAYDAAERQYGRKLSGLDPEVDVLLVGASSLSVVKDRYPSYFTTTTTRKAAVRSLLKSMPVVGAY